MKKDEFDDFFRPYSKNVDQANSLAFWKLSDAIITQIIKRHVPAEIEETAKIMDAGGGTGRWITELASIYQCDFVLYDLSEDMLAKARENIQKSKIDNRVDIVHGDLTDMSDIQNESIDYIVSIYSPISFVEDKQEALKQLYSKLKPGGVMLIMGHGYHNAIASKINNYQAPSEELRRLADTMKVKWAEHVPILNTFSKESMEELLTSTGFSPVATYGVPIFVQPGPEDFDPSNALKSKISTALEDPEFFQSVLGVEMRYNSDPTVANRGMKIFSVVQKK